MSAGLRLVRDADLGARNTFRVPARAPLLIEVMRLDALDAALGHAGGAAPLVLGGGSNLLFAGDAPGPVLSLQARGIAIVGDAGDRAVVRAEGGAQWHALVRWTLEHGLCGLENLALIPGTVGAAPIQNIGAYGVEVGEFVHAVEAFVPGAGMRRLGPAECGFGYRDSVFKRDGQGWIVTAVEFSLPRDAAPRTGYAGVREALAAAGISDPSPMQVFDAVCALRRSKLPDPATIGNAGSFFKNPVLPLAQAQALVGRHPGLPLFPGADAGSRKLSAAWLIDACGWKGHRDGDAGVSERHALVLVNHGSASGAQLLALARRIAGSVEERFGVALEPEPRIVGARW